MKTYKKNLVVAENKVYSYDILVAEIIGNKLKQLPYSYEWKGEIKTFSPTTKRHLNYLAQKENLTLI